MTYILFDDAHRRNLLPFTHTRPVADIRCGILTMRERWEQCLATTTGTLTEDYLQQVFPTKDGEQNLYINGGVFGSMALANAIYKLEAGQILMKGELVIAANTGGGQPAIAQFLRQIQSLPAQQTDIEVNALKNVWDIFSQNDRAIREDYALLTLGRTSAAIPEHVTVAGKEHLFIEDGARIYPGTIINATAGPVYIGKDAEIMEGAIMRGPLALCEHATIKMGAKIYGATTIGPGCKVGGEISNTVFFANSNKGHDGFTGNAVIGEWCNLGADTNCSNLKNNYDTVKIWHEADEAYVSTGLTFCGLLMGDHSKCGINTMFNTGTVTGVSCNIYGGDFPDKYIPSFSWGGETMVTYAFDKAMDTANRMMGRRGQQLTPQAIAMYRYIFDHSKH